MLHDIQEDDYIKWHPPIDKGITSICEPVNDLDLITEFDFLSNAWGFYGKFVNECGMPTEDSYFSGHLVLSYFGTCICSNVETNLS